MHLVPNLQSVSANSDSFPGAAPTLVAVEMGYGHLRPAHALSSFLGIPVLHADQPPVADEGESQGWARTRRFYETLSRISSAPLVGKSFGRILDSITAISPLYPARDLSRQTAPVKLLSWTAQRGLGRSLVAHLRAQNSPLVATFYTPAIVADYHGYDRIYCVVTDSDVQRIWVSKDPASSNVRYFAPTGRVVARLRSYGVPREHIDFTGFPLPDSLVGGPSFVTLRANLLARLARLDPRGVFRSQYAAELASWGPQPELLRAEREAPPRITFAVGGAGAQSEYPGLFLPSLADPIRRGKVRVSLIAGIRRDVARIFEDQIAAAGLSSQVGGGIDILLAPDMATYFTDFDALMARTDVLWTKPSELAFFAALGIPLVLAPPVGRHENYNRRWLLENGAGLNERDPRVAWDWLTEWLTDGTLAAAAWAGHKRLPSGGLYRIADRLTGVDPRTRATLVPPQ